MSMPEVSLGRKVMYLAASSPWEAGPCLTRRGRHTRLSSDLLCGIADCSPKGSWFSPLQRQGPLALSSSQPPCHTIFSPSYLSKELTFFPSNIGTFSIILGKPKKDKNLFWLIEHNTSKESWAQSTFRVLQKLWVILEQRLE